MPGLLVDTLHQTHADVELNTDVLKDFVETETVELLSAEDSIIELGGRARQTPPEVSNWNLATVQVGDAAMRLVAKSASDAWFELIMPELPLTDDAPTPAVPVQLRVELGDGSWESSLIARKPTEDGKPDMVVFDLVIAWR